MSPQYRRVLTRLLGAVYAAGTVYGLHAASLTLVGVVIALAALTYLAACTTDVLVERDWSHLLPPRRVPGQPTLPPPPPADEETR
jgi:hypothetical protein